MTRNESTSDTTATKGAGAKPPREKREKKAGKSAEGAPQAAAGHAAASAGTTPRLFKTYQETVRPQIMAAHGIRNLNAAPRLLKVVVSMGVGAARENKALAEAAAADLTLITGQKAALRSAKKAVASFRLREGMPIGCMVTLRGHRMWEFLDRLIAVVIPRIKDFRGLKRGGFDGRGNYSMGLSDQTVFPEIDLDKIKHSQGMNITVVTTAGRDALAVELLERLGMPFRKDGDTKDTPRNA